VKRKFSYSIIAFGLVMLFAFGLSSTARADDWDLKTVFTINRPVSIPGHVVLPAGSYVIKRLNTVNAVVQILDQSETKVYATLLPISDFVMNPPDKPMITFQEMPEGSAPALKSWYYPGRNTAYEFITEASHQGTVHGN
jgi:hypothetical protein